MLGGRSSNTQELELSALAEEMKRVIESGSGLGVVVAKGVDPEQVVRTIDRVMKRAMLLGSSVKIDAIFSINPSQRITQAERWQMIKRLSKATAEGTIKVFSLEEQPHNHQEQVAPKLAQDKPPAVDAPVKEENPLQQLREQQQRDVLEKKLFAQSQRLFINASGKERQVNKKEPKHSAFHARAYR